MSLYKVEYFVNYLGNDKKYILYTDCSVEKIPEAVNKILDESKESLINISLIVHLVGDVSEAKDKVEDA